MPDVSGVLWGLTRTGFGACQRSTVSLPGPPSIVVVAALVRAVLAVVDGRVALDVVVAGTAGKVVGGRVLPGWSSLPSSPVIVSWPSPPCSESSPAPPSMTSAPEPPTIRSCPSPPVSLSAPLPPFMVFLGPVAVMVSLPAPPLRLSKATCWRPGWLERRRCPSVGLRRYRPGRGPNRRRSRSCPIRPDLPRCRCRLRRAGRRCPCRR